MPCRVPPKCRTPTCLVHLKGVSKAHEPIGTAMWGVPEGSLTQFRREGAVGEITMGPVSEYP